MICLSIMKKTFKFEGKDVLHINAKEVIVEQFNDAPTIKFANSILNSRNLPIRLYKHFDSTVAVNKKTGLVYFSNTFKKITL